MPMLVCESWVEVKFNKLDFFYNTSESNYFCIVFANFVLRAYSFSKCWIFDEHSWTKHNFPAMVLLVFLYSVERGVKSDDNNFRELKLIEECEKISENKFEFSSTSSHTI